jgi:flagellar hook assembly protein FlgD
MKNRLKKVSTILMIIAASVSLNAASPISKKNPGEREIKSSTPTIQVKGQRVFVNHLNLDGETVILKVYDEENRLLYLKKFDKTPVVEKAFNFEKAYEGTYSVVLNDGETSFTATVVVEI